MGWVLIALVVLLWGALGPWTIAVVGGLLLVGRVRARVPRPRFTWRGGGIAAAIVAGVAAVVVLLPDGLLPIPGAGGLLVSPGYEGRQVAAKPLEVQEPSQHPWLADSQASRPGPLGDLPEAETAWYGLESCHSMQFASTGRLVAICSDRRGPVLRVIDPEAMRPVATKRLPAPPESDDPVRAEACSGSHFYLDNGDRAVVATADGRIQAIATADAAGEPDLTVDQSWNLEKLVGKGDCVVRALTDWSGRIWWASHFGRVGLLDTVAGGAKVVDLDEKITQPFTVDESGVFLATDTAIHRLVVDDRGAAKVSWRTEYDRGVEVKSGQLVQGTGSGPTLVDGNLVALADNAEPRTRVVFLDRSTGAEVCSSAVFDGGQSATETSLVSIGTGVVVSNDHGNRPTATILGFAPSGGVARVDHEAGKCRVVWTSDVRAVGTRPVVSWATGLVYTATKRPSLWGVSAWYLTALDARTGTHAFSVRTGTGAWQRTHHSVVALNEDGAAFVGNRSGLVRVRDVRRDRE